MPIAVRVLLTLIWPLLTMLPGLPAPTVSPLMP
jgi:hypothetical protein